MAASAGQDASRPVRACGGALRGQWAAPRGARPPPPAPGFRTAGRTHPPFVPGPPHVSPRPPPTPRFRRPRPPGGRGVSGGEREEAPPPPAARGRLRAAIRPVRPIVCAAPSESPREGGGRPRCTWRPPPSGGHGPGDPHPRPAEGWGAAPSGVTARRAHPHEGMGGGLGKALCPAGPCSSPLPGNTPSASAASPHFCQSPGGLGLAEPAG